LETSSLDTVLPGTVPVQARRLSWAGRLRLLPLSAVVALAAALRLVNLAALGYANHYYTAGVASMLQSWHNFFFVAAEPGAAVSIDKPPVGLWLQAISAYFLGVNGPAMVLPEILCGLLSVVVLYHLVRRSFGTAAGLLAALAMAVTPIVVATDRNNTMDSSLILVLLLAAWAFVKATESGRLRHLLLGAALVGIGFNIKMLQAFLPLPAFYALYFLGAPARWWRKVAHLALATVLLLAVSLSWAAAVELTPADQRPYVGSSGNNSVFNLILGYNGIERLTGMGGSRGGSPGGNFPGAGGGRPQIGPGGGNLPPQGPAGNGNFQRPGGGAPGGGGFPGTGQAGVLRLFTTPLSKEVSWLLPFGLFSVALVALRQPLRLPVAPKPRAVVLWGGWLLTSAVFFSIAGFFHEYYLSMLAAPLAALVGIGVLELWHLRERRPWLAAGLLLSAAGATLGLQYLTATAYVGWAGWLAVPLVLLGLGAVLLGLSTRHRQRLLMLAGTASVVSAMLFVPGVWSALTMLNSSANQSLPSAYSGQASGPANGGDVQVNQALLAYLEANTQGVKYLMAVPSAMQGADYVIATGRPVLYLGGFMGQDNVFTAEGLAAIVANGELRYVYTEGGGGGRGFGSQTDVSAWVTAHCTAVTGYDTVTRNSGAPDGTGNNGNGSRGFDNMQVSLYDCAR
jgi:4-amino-4-deoxy-L-arabinose transferase-like glycosyltransferase